MRLLAAALEKLQLWLPNRPSQLKQGAHEALQMPLEGEGGRELVRMLPMFPGW